jgi:Bacterial regulatory proteins, luxR family
LDELNEHRLRTVGDFYLKRSEQHVHHSADYPGSDANRRLTDVALQLRLGILPKRRLRLDLDHCACVGPGGPRIAAHGLPCTGFWPRGKSSKEVASLLKHQKTAKTHRSNITRKLDIHSIRDLVVYAVKNDIIQVQASEKGGADKRLPFEAFAGEGLACLAPLLNITFLLNLGFAGDTGVPLVHLLLSFLSSNSVSFLDFADQLIGLTVDDIEIIIRQFSPTLLYRPFHLFPFAL